MHTHTACVLLGGMGSLSSDMGGVIFVGIWVLLRLGKGPSQAFQVRHIQSIRKVDTPCMRHAREDVRLDNTALHQHAGLYVLAR